MTTQYRLVVLDIFIRSRKRMVVNKMCPKIRWRDLKVERMIIFKDKVIDEGERNFEGETTTMWNQILTILGRLLKRCLESQNGRDTII